MHTQYIDMPNNVESTAFNIEKYFSTVGLLNFKLSPSLETLIAIIESHLLKFNYHNRLIYEAGKVSTLYRQIPSLSQNNLLDDIIDKQGGYCFQHLELLFAVLAKIGFNVDRYLAKIILQPCIGLDPNYHEDYPKTHELLSVHLNNTSYIIDVGMANQSLRKPLELKEGVQTIDDDQYRLSRIGGEQWVLDVKTIYNNKWFCLYKFLSQAVKFEDIQKAHENLFLTEKVISIRDNQFLVGKTTLEKRKYVSWFANKNSPGIFQSIKKNNPTPKIKEFSSLDEVQSFAKIKFKLS